MRDLTALAPVQMRPEERRGFTGLRRWVESPDFHLARLGVNAVELQPVQEFDCATPEEYHWGYMPVNWFAPASAYALAPAAASQVRELQELVAAFHRRGLAVLLDVVYNHVGVPPHLMHIDKLYYFEQDGAGTLAQLERLRQRRAGPCRHGPAAHHSTASRHLIEVYGVDGFRFDLAELLGLEVLREIEAALKRVKPDVVLIAEPWSFRGHIAQDLRPTGFASWNDGYRNFLQDYVRGGGTAEEFEYFLQGSPGSSRRGRRRPSTTPSRTTTGPGSTRSRRTPTTTAATRRSTTSAARTSWPPSSSPRSACRCWPPGRTSCAPSRA